MVVQNESLDFQGISWHILSSAYLTAMEALAHRTIKMMIDLLKMVIYFFHSLSEITRESIPLEIPLNSPVLDG